MVYFIKIISWGMKKNVFLHPKKTIILWEKDCLKEKYTINY